jgi:hypothetical protein
MKMSSHNFIGQSNMMNIGSGGFPTSTNCVVNLSFNNSQEVSGLNTTLMSVSQVNTTSRFNPLINQI